MNDDMRASLRASMPGAAALAAQVVMGKALRDALFLARWPTTALPLALAVSAIAAAGVAMGLAWSLARMDPRKLSPVAWVGSALLLGIEAWWSEGGSKAAAFVIYVHLSAVASGLASLFWIQMGEAFDPRSAKRAFAWTSAIGTAGALGASFVATPLAQMGGYGALIATVAALQLGCAAASPAIRPLGGAGAHRDTDSSDVAGGVAAIARQPYLLRIAMLVIALSVATTMLDYVFKARIAAHYLPAQRVGIFVRFYAWTSALAFAGQLLFTRLLLGEIGLARTVALLPAAMSAATGALLAFPGLALTFLARGTEAVLRGSVFRSGYELLFTPLAAAERRATKTVLDVGADRAGDGLGALILAVALGLAGVAAERAILALSVGVSIVAAVIAVRLHRGYVDALARGLQRGTVDSGAQNSDDRTTRETLLTTLGGTRGLDAAAIRAHLGMQAEQARAHAADAREAGLLSGDPDRIRGALLSGPIAPSLATLVIPLLGRDDVATDVLHALRSSVDDLLPELEAALRDPATPIAVRRRLPRAIARGESPRVWETLLAGLDDARFDVRLQCGLALDRWRTAHPGHRIDTERIFDLVVRELRRDREVWEARRRIATGHPTLFDQAVRQRSERSFALVFTLLALALPPEPMRLAHRGLLATDPHLRGTALEYLETVLPPRVRDGLWPYLEERPGTRPHLAPEEALERLVQANPSMAIAASELTALPGRDPDSSGVTGPP